MNSCDEMDGAKLQRKRLYELQDYIDAQYGGPGKGFLRVVTDPFQARRVVADGKLAVVMGMETSALFGCRGNDQTAACDRGRIDRGLAEFRKLGVRSFFPVHKFDNPLGGTKMDGGTTGLVVNPGNKIAFGSFWDARTCTGAETDNTQTGNGGALAGAVAGTPLQGVIGGQTPAYPPGPHCNSRGLTSLGRYMIDKLMDSKSIVEIDHMGALSRNQTLDILEKRRYSGVISAHTWASPLNYPRIYKLGGMVTPAAGSQGASSFVKEWAAYRKLRDKRFYFGFGYGSDTNGLAVQGSPPEKPLAYPFTALDGKTKMDRQVTGAAHLRLQQGGRGPLRPVRRLAGRPAPHRRPADGARDEPRRRGLPADVGARRGRQADHVPQRHGRGHLAAAAGARPAGRTRVQTCCAAPASRPRGPAPTTAGASSAAGAP